MDERAFPGGRACAWWMRMPVPVASWVCVGGLGGSGRYSDPSASKTSVCVYVEGRGEREVHSSPRVLVT